MLDRIFLHIRSRFFLLNLGLLLTLSILSGHLIVMHGTKDKFLDLIKEPYYHLSVAYSAAIAMTLLAMIYSVSYLLDKKYKGLGLNRQWMFYQLLYGVVLVLVVELLLAGTLFYWQGFLIWETAFFRIFFGPIVLFVLLVNLAYLIFYLQRNPRVEHVVRYLVPRRNAVELALLAKEHVPAILYLDEWGTWAFDFNGEKADWDHSLDASGEFIQIGQYFRGQRHWLVHRKAVRSVEPQSNRTVRLYLEIDFPHELIVSRRRSREFKAWLDSETV